MNKDLRIDAARFRGEIINDTVWLEKRMDNYIASYFCNERNKYDEMHLLFLGDNRMSFEGKKQIFDFLSRKYDLEWYKNYKSTRTAPIKKGSIAMNNDLCYIMEQRNILAHCVLDTKNFMNYSGIVPFLRFKNEEKRFEFTEKIFNEIRLTLANLTYYFLQREISGNADLRKRFGFDEIEVSSFPANNTDKTPD